jgi:hypothetical protein
MSWFSRVTGQDARRNRAAERSKQEWGVGNDPGDQFRKAILNEQQGGGWEDAFQRTAGATINNALPQLRQQLQLTREDAIRRGVSTGDLGTSNEGDLVSAWSRNLDNTLGSMAMQGYENNRNRYLDLLTGRMDRDTASKNRVSNTLSGLFSGASQAAAAYYGGS